uniref:hypothetical protein n=1 Tax=Candidatus Fimivicinus sp. TaxID=3056640 RepID=UPI003FEEAE8B
MKRNMTRLIALMMALALLFSLAACKDGKEKTDPSIGPAVVSNDSSETLDAAKPEEGPDTATGEGGSQASENPSDHANTQHGGQDTPTTPGGQQATQPGGQTLPASGIRATTDKAYVLQLYKDCLVNVKSQKPGHVKKEYQAITNHNLGNGIGTVLELLEKLDIFKTEETADARETAKGDKEQGRMLKCTLTNVKRIKSAACTKSGSNYKVIIVTTTAVDPDANSDFAKIMKPITHSEVDEYLHKGIVKPIASIDGYQLAYRDCKIEFVVNEKKQFQSLSQTMPCDITAYGRIGFSNRGKDDPFKATLTNYVTFSSFKW